MLGVPFGALLCHPPLAMANPRLPDSCRVHAERLENGVLRTGLEFGVRVTSFRVLCAPPLTKLVTVALCAGQHGSAGHRTNGVFVECSY